MSIKKALKGIPVEQVAQEEDDEFLSTRARRFLLSSSLVRDACVSRLVIDFKRDLVSVKTYERFYAKWAVTLYHIIAVINLATILIEYPAAISFGQKGSQYQIVLAINLVCEAYFYYRWYLINAMSEKKGTWDSLTIKLTILILCLMSLDAFIYLICNQFSTCVPVRWSRFLRPILLLTFPENYRLRAAFVNLGHTVVDVLPVFGLLMSTIAVVSVVSVTTLAPQGLTYPNGSPYFASFLEVFWDMYILVTTANSPGVIIPAYEHNRVFISVYILMCTVCNWLFLGILMACVYNSYKSHLGKTVMQTVSKRKSRLDEAFHLVATQTPGGEMGISQGTFMRLMRIAKPGRTEDALKVLFQILDKTRSGYLNKAEFSRLAEYVRVHLMEIELSRAYFEMYLPKFYNLYTSGPFQLFKRIVQHRVTSFFFVCLVVVNALTAILLRRFPSIQESVEWFFTIFFIIEVSINYVCCGGVRFFKDRWNVFDCFIVVGALCCQLLQDGLQAMGISMASGLTQMMLLLRLFRLVKFLTVYESFKVVINCILTILPSLGAYASVLLILYYIYACFGLELFSYRYEAPERNNYTKIKACYSDKLLDTEFVNWHYCLFNFNSITESYILLFALTVGNNWHVLTEGVSRTTSRWARVYFLFVHWTCVLLILNVILAFIIEAFLIGYDAQNTQFELYIRERLKELGMDGEIELQKRGIHGLEDHGFYLTHKQLDLAFPPNSPVSKAFILKPDAVSVEVMMFRMFEKEIEEQVTHRAVGDRNPHIRAHDAYSVLDG